MSETPAIPPIPKPSAGCWLFTIPVGLLVAVIVGYVTLYVMGMAGRPPEGDRVAITFQGCAEARPIIDARVATMGLGDAVWTDESTLEATLPSDRGVAEAIPATLAKPGRFEIRHGERVVVSAEHVAASSVHLATEGPVTLVRLDTEGATSLRDHAREYSGEEIAFVLDGAEVGTVRLPRDPGTDLQIPATVAGAREQLAVAAERSVVIHSGPLPCDVQVSEVKVIEAATRAR